VRNLGKTAGHSPTDTPGWRIDIDQFRMVAFEYNKLLEKAVVFAIRDYRLIELVVSPVVLG
jgi:hypothetical protein